VLKNVSKGGTYFKIFLKISQKFRLPPAW